MPSIILHILNEDPVLGEIDNLPSNQDTIIVINNPRRRDEKDLTYLDASVTKAIWPLVRIHFIEILPSAKEDEIITFVRE